MENILSSKDIIEMKKIGKLAHIFLQKLKRIIRAGMATKDIENSFNDYLGRYKVESAFLGYSGYPGSLCVSVNEEIIHGIPDAKKIIKDGDVVSVDLGIKNNGLFVDCAYTYLVGRVDYLKKKLAKVCMQALMKGIKEARPGNTTGDIGFAVQKVVESNGFSVVRKFVGHGVGKDLHCYPEVPNFGEKGEGALLKEGMAIAIEPMVSAGSYDVEVLNDGWTVRTKDGSLSCHFEHTVAITKKGPFVIA
ncbi:MAG: type I methionyl aminopeptidase [Candidatus Omnitrophica bacterium 4484_171]|nr:MAG: type I methionyl aminopeptidase [Candidatus Omnitrophica bacterium 4484_171]